MKLFKIAIAVGMLASGVVLDTIPAQAQPGPGWHHPRHRVCRTVWRHGHRIRKCSYR